MLAVNLNLRQLDHRFLQSVDYVRIPFQILHSLVLRHQVLQEGRARYLCSPSLQVEVLSKVSETARSGVVVPGS